MSRTGASSQQRQLTLTEELEKLEQSITLTLQEIDHNFNRAHRIVTSSILPVVEQYASHSKDVWEGSRFWKQFFESSANVSLSGYEEQSSTLDRADETITEDSNANTQMTLETSESYDTPSAQHISTDSIQDLDVSNLTTSPSQSTPRAKILAPKSTPATADYSLPYKALQEEITANSTVDVTTGPETPQRSPEVAGKIKSTVTTQRNESSPFLPRNPMSNPRLSTIRQKADPLMHRVLDRNYRVQATPMSSKRYATKSDVTKTPATVTRTRTRLLEPTLSSSPEIAAPELHAEIFSSPERKARTPGVSVLTPGRRKIGTESTKDKLGGWDSDDELDEEDSYGLGGISPPKTMQFHIPQRRLLKTPAKEASKRIVEDLLLTAGMAGGRDDDFTDEFDTQGAEMDGRLDEDSPSVIRKAQGFEDQIF